MLISKIDLIVNSTINTYLAKAGEESVFDKLQTNFGFAKAGTWVYSLDMLKAVLQTSNKNRPQKFLPTEA